MSRSLLLAASLALAALGVVVATIILPRPAERKRGPSPDRGRLERPPGPARPQHPPATFFGVQGWDPPSPAHFQAIGRAGIGTYRSVLNWGSVEPRPGARDWTEPDELMRRAASAGVRVLPVLIGSPSFAAAKPTFPPFSRRGRRAYAAFVRDAVDRYRPRGPFWRHNPHLPHKAPIAWQVWNEPNLRSFWGRRPSPRAYVSLLRPAARAIRASDARARVVLAGVAGTPRSGRRDRYLRRLYGVRGARALFDVVAVHPYDRTERAVVRAAARFRAIMARAGDARKPLWITEVGWGTQGPRDARSSAHVTTEIRQAQLLRRTFKRLLRLRLRFRIGLVVWFSWQDRTLWPGERDWWAPHTGLLRLDGEPKPAWFAYGRITRGR